jgi:hypothetical protein
MLIAIPFTLITRHAGLFLLAPLFIAAAIVRLSLELAIIDLFVILYYIQKKRPHGTLKLIIYATLVFASLYLFMSTFQKSVVVTLLEVLLGGFVPKI